MGPPAKTIPRTYSGTALRHDAYQPENAAGASSELDSLARSFERIDPLMHSRLAQARPLDQGRPSPPAPAHRPVPGQRLPQFEPASPSAGCPSQSPPPPNFPPSPPAASPYPPPPFAGASFDVHYPPGASASPPAGLDCASLLNTWNTHRAVLAPSLAIAGGGIIATGTYLIWRSLQRASAAETAMSFPDFNG